MRALFLFALTGCTSLLGISDPKPATDVDAMVDSNTIDAPPPCTASITLKAEVSSDVGATGTDFVIGRFDNGLPEDIAVAVGTNVVILHGDRTGAFGADAMPVMVGSAATLLAIEDFDAIGFDDLALVSGGGTAVTVRLQDRALTPPFKAEQALTGPFTNVQRIVAEHLDGNLRADLLVYDAAAGSRVYTSNASGAPTPFTRENIVVGVGADELLFMRQIDNAQRADAMFVNGGDVKLSLQTNGGTGAFGALSTITTSATSKGIAVGKFDGDNLLDVVVSTSMGLVLFRQVPATPGTFQVQGVISPLQSAAPMLVTDLNDDGRDDIVLANAAILQCAALAPGGPGVFTQVEQLNASPPAKLADVNGDTKPDLVRLEGTSVKVRLK